MYRSRLFDELARRAEERYDAVNRDFMQAALLPDGLERRKALAREEKRQRELSRSDTLYRLEELSRNIDFYQNAGETATTLQLLNNALRERQELAAELLQEEKKSKITTFRCKKSPGSADKSDDTANVPETDTCGRGSDLTK